MGSGIWWSHLLQIPYKHILCQSKEVRYSIFTVCIPFTIQLNFTSSCKHMKPLSLKEKHRSAHLNRHCHSVIVIGTDLNYLHIVGVGGSSSCWFHVNMSVKPPQSENIQADIQMTLSSQHWNLYQSQCRFEMAEGLDNSGAGRLER